jgi:hypothetical protein
MASILDNQLKSDDIDKSRQQLGYSQQFTQELRDQESIANNLNSIYGQNSNQLKNFNNIIKGTISEANALNEAIKGQLESLKKTNEFSSRYAELQSKISKAEKDFTENQEKSRDIANNLSSQAQTVAQQYIDGLTARYKLTGKIAELEKKKSDYEAAKRTGRGVDDAKAEFIEAGLVVKKLKEKLEVVDQVNTGQGFYVDNLSAEEKLSLKNFAIAQKQMDVSRNIVNNHQDELDILEDQLTTFQKIVSRYLYFKEQINEAIKNSKALTFIYTQLTNVVGKLGLNFNTILDNVLKLDKVLTDFGKSVQVSKEGARALADSFQSTSFRAKEINSNVSATMASIKNQVEANNELNKSLGTGALFTEKSRLDQIELTKGMGLEAETASKLYQLGSLNQKTAKQTAIEIGDQVVNFRKATGITLDYRKVLADVSKISGQLAVQYKNNPDLIAQAVIKTKELGMTLEQANNASKQLLNFTTSIESELEAELLTGKAINLEQARYYALMGDSASAAKELMNNVGGLGEFQKLNVLQQQSLAKAIGMGVDELSDTLVQQELLKGTAFQTKVAFEEVAREAARTGDYTKLNAELAQAANGEELASQAAQISNQEKFQMAIEKLQETIANMVNGPLGTMLDKFTTIVSKAWVLKGIVAAITTAFAINMVKGLVDVGAGLAKLIKPLATIAKLETLSAAMKSFGLGVVIAGAAALAGYAAINALASDGGGDGGADPSISGGSGVNVPMRGGPPQQQQQININNQFTLNNRDLGYISTQQDGVGTRRMA